MKKTEKIKKNKKYRFTVAELVRYGAGYAAVWGELGFLFYRSIAVAAVFIAAGLPVSFYRQRTVCAQRKKEELSEQFKDCILSLAVSLRAGYSVENAWEEVYREMVLLHGEKSVIAVETADIRRKLRLRIPVEELLTELGAKSGIDDIRDFADVFKLAKRGGGDMVSVIGTTARTIGDKYDVQREITGILTAKRFEQRIMLVMPAAILMYLSISNQGFLDILYECAEGRFIMSACLAVYGAAFLIGERIVKINV